MKNAARALILLVSFILIAGCNDEEAYYEDLYAKTCPEAKTVAFKDLKATSTCKGNPLILELARFQATDRESDYLDHLGYTLQNMGFDFDVQEKDTGRTPLMIAMAGGNLFMINFFFKNSKKRDLLDRAGRHYLHYASQVNWRVDENRYGAVDHDLIVRNIQWYTPSEIEKYKAERAVNRGDMSPYAQGANLEIRDASGLTPAELAYRAGNWEALWSLIKAGARVDFLTRDTKSIDPGFLFNILSEDVITFFDKVPDVLDRKYNGSVFLTYEDRLKNHPTVLKDYTFLEQAHKRCSPELSEYLVSRGIIRQNFAPCEDPELGSGEMWKVIDYFKGHQWYFKENSWMREEKVANRLGQNFAHYYLNAATAAQANSDFGVWYDGFNMFLDLAVKHEWLEDPDFYGNTPAFYWLSAKEQTAPANFIFRKLIADRFTELLIRLKKPAVLNRNGDSLLTYAVLTGKIELVRAAVNAVPEFKTLAGRPNAQGKTPIQLAQDQGMGEISAYLSSLH